MRLQHTGPRSPACARLWRGMRAANFLANARKWHAGHAQTSRASDDSTAKHQPLHIESGMLTPTQLASRKLVRNAGTADSSEQTDAAGPLVRLSVHSNVCQSKQKQKLREHLQQPRSGRTGGLHGDFAVPRVVRQPCVPISGSPPPCGCLARYQGCIKSMKWSRRFTERGRVSAS